MMSCGYGKEVSSRGLRTAIALHLKCPCDNSDDFDDSVRWAFNSK